METDLRACSAGLRTPAGRSRPGDRYAETGRPLTARPGRPAVAAAVSNFLFASGTDISGSEQHATHPFGVISFPRIEFHLTGIAGRFDDMAVNFGETHRRIPAAMAHDRAGELKRVASMVPAAGRGRVRG